MKKLAKIAKITVNKHFQRYKASYYYHFLLASLILMTTVSLFIANNKLLITLFDFSYLSVLIMSAAAAFKSIGRTVWLLILLFSMTIFFRILQVITGLPAFEKLYHSLVMVILFMTFVIIMYSVMKSKRIDSNIISGAICGYLILGIICASIYMLAESTCPGSFRFTTLAPGHISPSELADEFYYYSMITLTSVGFGDTIPVSRLMKHVTILEAVAGQIYLTIIIARLVGIQISQRDNKQKEENS